MKVKERGRSWLTLFTDPYECLAAGVLRAAVRGGEWDWLMSDAPLLYVEYLDILPVVWRAAVRARSGRQNL